MTDCCIENACICNVTADSSVPLKLTCFFLFVCLLIDEQKNVLYIEFESAIGKICTPTVEQVITSISNG